MAKFMVHTATTIELPDRGLVVVTGPNGGGKSSLVEAVSVAVWNKSLRGTLPWQMIDGLIFPGQVTIETDEIVSTRKRTKSRSELRWSPVEGERTEYETTTKAQAALEAIVGDWNTWRRCSVFSSQDASHFTLATDAQRKSLLEAILDLGQFDVALEACRADLSVATAAAGEGQRAIEIERTRLEAAQQRLADAEQQLDLAPPEVDVEALRGRLRSLRGMLADIDADAGALQQKLRDADRRVAEAKAATQTAERDAQRLADADCPACGQPIPPELREALEGAVVAAQTAVEGREETAAEARDEAEGTLAELREDRTGLREQAAKVDAKGKAAAATSKAREAAITAKGSAILAIDTASTNVAALEAKITEAVQLVAELQACEAVLGYRGVRAHVLGGALGGIEHVANAWLARIAGEGLRLTLRAYTEKKTGGIADAISLAVEGAGGGHGYKASSGGERRRIDVALLMALAEVARSARGAGAGTVWFDEVFDALDEQGIEAVSEALAELSRDRAVVVISHSQNLVGQLRPALRLHISGGTVTAAR